MLSPSNFIKEMSSLKILRGGYLYLIRLIYLLPYHALIDQAKERLKGDKAIGTTGKGIGPAYVDKVARVGHRLVSF